MTNYAAEPLPKCRGTHSTMKLRTPPGGHTREQRWCGIWYDCTRCTSSVLYPSPALRAQLVNAS